MGTLDKYSHVLPSMHVANELDKMFEIKEM